MRKKATNKKVILKKINNFDNFIVNKYSKFKKKYKKLNKKIISIKSNNMVSERVK